MHISDLIKQSHDMAVDKGWWPSLPAPNDMVPEKLCLFHSEVSEALEEYRCGRSLKAPYYEAGKPCGFSIELADLAIRLFDFCGAYGIDLEAAIEEKSAYNATRPVRHGGKLA